MKNLSLNIETPNTVLGDASRLIPDLIARNLGENARVRSGISSRKRVGWLTFNPATGRGPLVFDAMRGSVRNNPG